MIVNIFFVIFHKSVISSQKKVCIDLMHRQSTGPFDFFNYLTHPRDFRANETYSPVIKEKTT
jgi:hypothetical protein